MVSRDGASHSPVWGPVSLQRIPAIDRDCIGRSRAPMPSVRLRILRAGIPILEHGSETPPTRTHARVTGCARRQTGPGFGRHGLASDRPASAPVCSALVPGGTGSHRTCPRPHRQSQGSCEIRPGPHPECPAPRST